MLKTFLILCFLAHPVHVSLLSVDYPGQDHSLSVFIKLYYDDFLLDAMSGKVDSRPVFLQNDTSAGPDLMKYIDEKIDICINNHRLKGEIINVSLIDNELRVNLRFESPGKVDNITVRNRVMTEIYDDQANMVIVRIKDFEEGVKLTSSVTEKTFEVR